MSRRLEEDYKVLALIAPAAITSTTTGSAVDVEPYDDDALAIVHLGTFTSTPTITPSITGSLVATPTTYNQTLATLTAMTATGLGIAALNLNGIKNVKGVLTLSGGTDPSVPASFELLVKPFVKSASTN